MTIVAVVADVQVGHEAALWPDGFLNHINHKWQKVLMQYWEDCWSCEDARNAEFVINLAESIEGNNRKDAGRHLVDVNLNHQKDAFVDLIKDYAKDRKYIGVDGSAYHNGLDYNVEEEIAKDVGGEFYGSIANLKFKKTGHVIFATHKAGDAFIYKAQMLDRSSLYFSAIKSKLEEDPDMLLYGHHHQYFRTDTVSRINVIAPTWKFWHPIKGAAKFPQTQPTIGSIFLKLPDNRGQIEIVKKTYKLEHIYSAIREV